MENRFCIYTAGDSSACKEIREIFVREKIPYHEYEVNLDQLPQELTQEGLYTVPQIFFGKSHIGSEKELLEKELLKLESEGRLDTIRQDRLGGWSPRVANEFEGT